MTSFTLTRTLVRRRNRELIHEDQARAQSRRREAQRRDRYEETSLDMRVAYAFGLMLTR